MKAVGLLGNEANLRVNIPTIPSYSFIHSLKEGFELVMYSCTHNTWLDGELSIHKNQVARLILAPDMSLRYHEATLHGVSKSRQFSDENDIIQIQEDMCFFNYSWPETQNNSQTRIAGTTNGITREYGHNVYCDYARIYVCPNLHADPSSFLECLQPQNAIDLRTIPAVSCDSRQV